MPPSSRRKAFVSSNPTTDPKCPKCIYKISKNFRVEKSGEISVGSRVFKSASGFEYFSPRRWCASTPTAFGSNADLHSVPQAAQNSPERAATPANTKGTPVGAFCVGWGSRIRTYECQSQSLVPYRLAIPQNSMDTLVLYHILFSMSRSDSFFLKNYLNQGKIY